MGHSFGARLRLQREQRHVPLTVVAAKTKIKIALLEGLERDDFSYWPAGIFRRAHVRAYAQAVGLEPGAVVREFLELYPDPPETIGDVPATPQDSDAAAMNGQTQTRLQRLVSSAVAAVPSLFHRVQEAPRADVNVPAAASNSAPGVDVVSSEPNLAIVARLCAGLGRAMEAKDAASELEEAARILGAAGLIVWSWDAHQAALRPWLAYGYSDVVLTQLPRVRRDESNPVAVAFRSAEPCIVERGDQPTGAVVVPLLTAGECVGVFALELKDGGENRELVRALATILATPLAALIAFVPVVEAVSA